MNDHTLRIYGHRRLGQTGTRAGGECALRNVGDVLDRAWSEQSIIKALIALEGGTVLTIPGLTVPQLYVVKAYLRECGFKTERPDGPPEHALVEG
jgi:hypothetical protein